MTVDELCDLERIREAQRRLGREARTRLSRSRRAVTRAMCGSRSTPTHSHQGVDSHGVDFNEE
jgi:hypothetical protein